MRIREIGVVLLVMVALAGCTSAGSGSPASSSVDESSSVGMTDAPPSQAAPPPAPVEDSSQQGGTFALGGFEYPVRFEDFRAVGAEEYQWFLDSAAYAAMDESACRALMDKQLTGTDTYAGVYSRVYYTEQADRVDSCPFADATLSWSANGWPTMLEQGTIIDGVACLTADETGGRDLCGIQTANGVLTANSFRGGGETDLLARLINAAVASVGSGSPAADAPMPDLTFQCTEANYRDIAPAFENRAQELAWREAYCPGVAIQDSFD